MARRSEWADWVPPDSIDNHMAALHVEPLYGPPGFSTPTDCYDIHPGGIKRGSSDYCEVCAEYGRDGFDSTIRSLQWDYSQPDEPEPKKPTEPEPTPKAAPKFKPRIRKPKQRKIEATA